MKFINEDYFTTRTNITTIYNQHLIRNYLQNILKMPSSKAWVWGGALQRSGFKRRIEQHILDTDAGKQLP